MNKETIINSALGTFAHLGGVDEIQSADIIDDTYYGFGSELGVLRLFAAYKDSKGARFGYSKNLETWYFAFDKAA